MSKSSKYFKGTLAVAVAVSSAVVAVPSFTEASTAFKDVSTKHNFYEVISNLSERGIIKGFEDGTFRPGDSVTRGQAAKIIAGILQLDTENVTNPGFKDITPSHPYYGPIAALANAEIISGYEDNTYRSGESVQRNHMAKIIAGAFNLTASIDYKTPLTDVNKSYAQYITALHQYNVTTGVTETTFNGSANVTRGQLAAFVVRAENATPTTAASEVEFTLTDVASSTIMAGSNMYKVAPALQALFAPSNKAALKNAVVKAKLDNGQITSITSLQLNTAGTKNAAVIFDAANAKVDGNLLVNADNVHVKNLQVVGNVSVTALVQNSFATTAVTSTGQLRIDKVAGPTATLTTVANTSTGPAISLTDSTFKQIDVQRDNVAIHSNKKIALITVTGNVSSIEINADITALKINVFAKLAVTGKGTIDAATIEKVTELALQIAGTIVKLTVVDNNAKLTLATTVKITVLVVPAGKNASSIITNYTAISKNIQSVQSAGGKGGGSGSNSDQDRDDDDEPASEDKPSTDSKPGTNEKPEKPTDNKPDTDEDREPKPKPKPEETVSTEDQAQIDIDYAASLIGDTVYLLTGTPITEQTVTDAILKLVNPTTINVKVEATTGDSFKVTISHVSEAGTPKELLITAAYKKFEMQPLVANKTSVNINESTTVLFEVKYNGPKESNLTLLKKDGSSYVPFENVVLKDDGNQPAGDLLAGDGKFSANANLNFTQSGVHEFAAGIQVNGEWEIVSKAATILALQPLSTKDAATIVAVSNTVQTKIQTLKQTATADAAVIKAAVVELLTQDTEVVSVGTSEADDFVWFTLKSGALSAVSLTTTSTNNVAVASLNPIAKTLSVANAEPTNAAIGSQRVVIFSAHGQTAGEVVRQQLANSEQSFTVHHFENEAASVTRFKEMFNYGTIIFDTVGASLFKGEFSDEQFPYLSELFNNNEEQVVLLTGEQVTESSLINYNEDLQTGRIVTVDGYYAITPAFVQHYGAQNEVKNALVYANSSYGLNNDTMATQFLNNKAAAYVGYPTGTTPDSMTITFNGLLDGKSLKDAIGNEQVKGTDALVYSKVVEATNGNFESGTAGWIGGGHFDSITQLGLNSHSEWKTLFPTEGNSMGIISSGVDDNALLGKASWAYQTFTVPTDMNVLKFDYNIVSNEPMEYLKSSFDDTFKATIVTGDVKEPTAEQYTNSYDPNEYNYDGYSIYNIPWLITTEDDNETIIAYESVNSSYWGKDSFDAEHRVDVEFPDGDSTVFQTGWKTLTYDISKFQGQTVSLKLQVWDLGDSAYPTAALVDNVRFTKVEKSDIILTGPTEIDGSNYETGDYQFNALVKDQFNDAITGDITLRMDENGYRQPVVEQAATFSLKEEIAGLSINTQTGILTVNGFTSADSVTVVATGDSEILELTVPIKKSAEFTDVANITINDTILDVTYTESLYYTIDGWGALQSISVADSNTIITSADTSFITAETITTNTDGYGFTATFTESLSVDPQSIRLNFDYGSVTLYRNNYGYWQFNQY